MWGGGQGLVLLSRKHLEQFLPVSHIPSVQTVPALNTFSRFYGYIAPFYGNFGICLRAYAYIQMLGAEGLKQVSENAVLNANYIMHSLKEYYDVPYLKTCMHECVFSAKKQMEHGVHAIDIAKGLIDRGIHPPTVYFPLIVKEALMVEPTETESKETIDHFITTMKEIAVLTEKSPQSLKNAPVTTPVSRLDETKAAKDMNFCYTE